MPRISDERRAERRRHILTSAWRCFARDGFHATSMDDVIAASGMSASGVYRYFSGKDELIDAAGLESMRMFGEMFAGLLDREAPPGPVELVGLLIQGASAPDLPRVAIQAWAEALRRPSLADNARAFHAELRANLTALAERWALTPGVTPEAAAALVAGLLPGIIVGHHVLGGVPKELLDAVAALVR